MMNVNDVAKVFDTILSIPGMGEIIKIDLKIGRKNVLLLNQVIGLGIAAKAENNSGLLGIVSEENLVELKNLVRDCLTKAGLNESNDKLKLLGMCVFREYYPCQYVPSCSVGNMDLYLDSYRSENPRFLLPLYSPLSIIFENAPFALQKPLQGARCTQRIPA